MYYELESTKYSKFCRSNLCIAYLNFILPSGTFLSIKSETLAIIPPVHCGESHLQIQNKKPSTR